ncbi:MAG: hypothetical protein CMO68_06085 [Verrucomicrobiales bacterium]|nr:hypothetical protein [Verrucomicrobiales bacterium]
MGHRMPHLLHRPHTGQFWAKFEAKKISLFFLIRVDCKAVLHYVGCMTTTETTKHNPDELNPAFLFSITATELLIKIAKGEIDANQLARKELENRGLSHDGVWVGFSCGSSASSASNQEPGR